MTALAEPRHAVVPDSPREPPRRRVRRPPVLLLLAATVAAVVAILPIVYLVDRAGSLGWEAAWRELYQQRTFDLLVRSLTLALVVTLLASVIGVAAAWLVVRSDVPGRRVWQVLMVLPLAVPSYAAAYAWLSWRPSLAPFPGSVLVLTLVSYPYVYLPVAAVFRRLDPAQDEVARSLGYGPARIAFSLTLRQARPAIAAGALLVSLYVLSDFGAVAMLRYEVFTFVIYGAYNAGFNPSRAAVLALALVFVAAVLVVAESWVRGRPTFARLGAGAPRRQVPVGLGRAQPIALAFLGAVFALGIVFPMWRFVYWTRRALDTAVPWADVWAALRHSLWLSFLAAVATVALAVPVGVLVARYRSRVTTVIERSTYVAHSLPGIVVAIALVFVGVRLLRSIYQEVPLLVLAYVVLFLPLAIGSVRNGIEQAQVRQEEVAQSLGKRWWQVLVRVTLPQAAPALAGGAALVFVTTMKELPATLLLRPTGMETLATRLWTYTAETNYAAGAPYVMGLVLFAAIPTALLSRFIVDRNIARDDGFVN
jgi:iron(III) transport system permease protein